MKKAYFYVNGNIRKKDSIKNKNELLKLDSRNDYEIYNFGVSTNFEDCKQEGLKDVITDTKGNRHIVRNSYVVVLEISLIDKDYFSIDDNCFLADFDILKKIKKPNTKIVYSAKFDKDLNFVENFIKINKSGANKDVEGGA